MNKLAVSLMTGVGVVIVAGIAAAPYVSGVMIEKRMQSASVLPGGVANGLNWSLDSFQRGYLRSTATSHITLNTPDGAPIVLQFKQTIDQVPGIDGRYAEIRTVWVPDAQMKPRIEQLFSGKEPVVLNTALTIFGGSHTQGEFAPINQPGLVFSGGKLTMDMSANGKYAYAASFDHLNLSEKSPTQGMPQGISQGTPQTVSFKGITLDAGGMMDPKTHIGWDGQFALNVASLTAGSEGALSGLALTGHSERTGSHFAFGVGLDVAKAAFAGAPPAFQSMMNLKFEYGLSRIDAPALEAMIKQVQEAQRQGMNDPEQIKQVFSASLMNHLPELLDAGPEFKIDPISFTLPDGTVAMHFSAKLPPGHGREGMNNPMSLVSLLNVKGDFSIPEAVYQIVAAETEPNKRAMNQQQLAQMIQKGYVIQNHGVLSTNFEFKSGQLTINGKPGNDLIGVMAALFPR